MVGFLCPDQASERRNNLLRPISFACINRTAATVGVAKNQEGGRERERAAHEAEMFGMETSRKKYFFSLGRLILI